MNKFNFNNVMFYNTKNVHNFLHISVPRNEDDKTPFPTINLKIVIDDIERIFTINSIHKELLNINIEDNKEVVVLTEGNVRIDVVTNDIKTFLPSMSWYEKISNITTDTYNDLKVRCIKKGNFNNPKKLVVLLPNQSRREQIKYPVIQFVDVFSKEIEEETAFLSLQDYYDAFGTYFQFDDKKNKVFKKYLEYIKKILKDLKLKESDLIFYGNGKGGMLSILFGYEFPQSKILSQVPNLSLNKLHEQQKYTLGDYTEGMFKQVKFNFEKELDVVKKFEEIVSRGQSIIYYYGEEDYFNHEPKVKEIIKRNNAVYRSQCGGSEVVNSFNKDVVFDISSEVKEYMIKRVEANVEKLEEGEEDFNFIISLKKPIAYTDEETVAQYIEFHQEDSLALSYAITKTRTNLKKNDIAKLALNGFKSMPLKRYLNDESYEVKYKIIDNSKMAIYEVILKDPLIINNK